MAMTSVSTTLREMLQELTDKRTSDLVAIQKCEKQRDQLRQHLVTAEQRAREAVHEDEEVVRKKMELLNLYDSSSDRPKVLLDKVNSLGDQQSDTYRRRKQTAENVRHARCELSQAETQLALAEKDQKETQDRIDECTTLIKQQEQIP